MGCVCVYAHACVHACMHTWSAPQHWNLQVEAPIQTRLKRAGNNHIAPSSAPLPRSPTTTAIPPFPTLATLPHTLVSGQLQPRAQLQARLPNVREDLGLAHHLHLSNVAPSPPPAAITTPTPTPRGKPCEGDVSLLFPVHLDEVHPHVVGGACKAGV